MKKTFVITLTLIAMVGSTAAFAKPQLRNVQQGADIVERPASVQADPGLATSASSDTFIWGPFDFETGWAGWQPFDQSSVNAVYGNRRLLDFSGSRGNGSLFTGKVLWTGELGANACGTKACFPGYANLANQVTFKTYASVSPGDLLTYNYRADSEPGYDFTYVIVSTSPPILTGGGSYVLPSFNAGDTLGTYDGFQEGSASFDLSAYAGLGSVTVYFNSKADGGWSDGDCLYQSLDGLFQIDDLMVGAESPATFETDNGGWTSGRVEGIGSFAKLESVATLPIGDPCPTFCGLAGNVITIYDGSDPNFHAVNQNEYVQSPVLDLTQNPSYPSGAYLMQFDVYTDLLLSAGNFYFWQIRYSPVEASDCSCLDPTDWSPWLNENTVYYGGGFPTCLTGAQFDVSAKVPGHAQRLQMAVGVTNLDYYTTSPGGNQSPYLDNVSLRAAKVQAPAAVVADWHYLQSAYPDAPTFAIAKSTPAFADAGYNIFTSRTKTRLGDSTTCTVALSCNSDQKVEVDYIFKVTPGPCLNTAHPWWVAYTAQPKIASGPLAGFAVARADTAQTSTNTVSASAGFGTFMGRFHESIPAAGTTYAAYGNWSGFTGGVEGISIFPDDVFTPGTRVEWVLHTTFIPVKGDFYKPDLKFGNVDGDRVGNQSGNQKWLSAGGTYDPAATFCEVYQVLPLTTEDGNTAGCASAQPAHCFLYVDRADRRGPQYQIENAFRNLGIAWDRYDVRAPTSAMGNDLGSRYTTANYPLGHAPGPLPSLLNEVYSAILWSTGTITATNFSRGSTSNSSDTGNAIGLLSDWCVTTSGGKYLWVNGDGNARFLNSVGNRLTFLNTVLGATYIGSSYRDKNPAWGVTLTGLGPDCTSGQAYGLRANWCPQRKSYNMISNYASPIYGTINTNFKYPDATGTWYAGVQQIANTGGFNFRTQLDAWSLENLRQDGVVYNGVNDNSNITNWAARALGSCFTSCFANLDLVGVGEQQNVAVNSLAGPRGPIVGGQASINFSLASAGKVSVRVYDASGRLVSTVLDNEARQAGTNVAQWDAKGLKGGVYFYQITANGFKSAKKIILVN